jgi:phosphoglycerate-specific signal transduction histidine kinase
MGTHLHGICQPLTALQCRLQLGEMEREPQAMSAAIVEALRECHRLSDRVRAMQSALRGAANQTARDEMQPGRKQGRP